jgi:anti-sigma regulatory factor (Ser/Thr protein kinase)
VATAVARRSGVDEALLDEVRLAVGEACSRAVEAHQEHCPAEPVRIALTGSDGRFEVVVTDTAAQGADAAAADDPGPGGGKKEKRGSEGAGGEQPAAAGQPRRPQAVPAELGLAVIEGLADDVEIARTKAGLSIRMSWPSAAAVAG